MSNGTKSLTLKYFVKIFSLDTPRDKNIPRTIFTEKYSTVNFSQTMVAQNTDSGKFWCFWYFPARTSNLTRQMYSKHYRYIVKDSNHLSKYFPLNIVKSASVKISLPQNCVLYGMDEVSKFGNKLWLSSIIASQVS